LDSDKDVLSKADALLRRHTPGGSETSAFPVLTDLIDDAGAEHELARDVFQRVMAEVEGRLAADLEARLALHFVPQIHAAVANALGDLREQLAGAIRDAVAEALKNRPAK
jgi:hypothetical protein